MIMKSGLEPVNRLSLFCSPGGGGGGTPLYTLYRYVPLDSVWGYFLPSPWKITEQQSTATNVRVNVTSASSQSNAEEVLRDI